MKTRSLLIFVLILGLSAFTLACESDSGDGGGSDGDTASAADTAGGNDTAAGDDTTTPGDDTTDPGTDSTDPGEDTAGTDTTTGMPNQERIDEAVAVCDAFAEAKGIDYMATCGQPDQTTGHADCDWFMCTYCYVLVGGLGNCESLPTMCLGGDSPSIFPPCDAEMIFCVQDMDCEAHDLAGGSALMGECQAAVTTCQEQYK